MSDPKRLYRSKKDKVIAGVCGGLGEFFSLDPVWIRIVFVIMILLDGIGILLYIIAWILVPQNPDQKSTKETKAEQAVSRVLDKVDKKKDNDKERIAIIIGALLVIIGLAFLMQYLFSWFSFHYVWPIIIILVGAYLIFRRDES